jgi:hypothetical protein
MRHGGSDRAKQALSPAEQMDVHLELYKIAVEMADRVSVRRGIANSFFLTVNTAVLAVFGLRNSDWYLAVSGVILCVLWWSLLRSYRALNAAKFSVILKMEKRLPVRLYADEWDELRADKHRELGAVERIVPWAFMLIYGAALVQQVHA